MPMNCGDLSPGNTLEVLFEDIEVDGVAVTGATCTVNVKNSAGSVVSNGGPITGTELSAGNYKAVIPSNVDIDIDARYSIVGVITAGGNTATWTEVKVAKVRKGGAGC